MHQTPSGDEGTPTLVQALENKKLCLGQGGKSTQLAHQRSRFDDDPFRQNNEHLSKKPPPTDVDQPKVFSFLKVWHDRCTSATDQGGQQNVRA
jgi:hypothetical protein